MRAMVAAIQAEKRQITRKALERGRQEGMQEGQTAMIVRLATQKFGEAAGDRLAALLALADNTDSDSGRMDQIAQAILDCKTSDELFAKVLA